MVAFPSTRPFVNLFTGKRHTRKSIELKPYEFIWALLK